MKVPKFKMGDFVYPLGSRDKCEVKKVILEKDVYWYHCEHITKIFGGTHITREDLLVPAEDKPKEITVEFSIPNPAVKMPEKVVIMANENKKSLNEILVGLSKRMAVIQISQDCFNEILKDAQALANIDPVVEYELIRQGFIGYFTGGVRLERSPDGLDKDELERLLEVFEAGVGGIQEYVSTYKQPISNINIAPNQYARLPGVYSEIATDGLVSRDSLEERLDILKRQIWESAVEATKELPSSPAEEVSIEADMEIMKSFREAIERDLYVDVGGILPVSQKEKQPEPVTTWTFRLKFPNGDEVEVPEPPKDQWVLKGTIIWDWPNKYVGIGMVGDNEDIIEEQAKCWWHDYKRRAREENAQVLWSKFWEKIPEKKPEPEKPVWEFLGDPKYL